VKIIDVNKRLQVGIKAARSAGDILQQYQNKIKNLKIKKNISRDVYSKVDIMSENKIFKIIKKKFKNDTVLGEESGQIYKKGNYKWIIDPLDGTVNYNHDIPIYSISIAIFYKKKCVAGIIYNPNNDEMYYASIDNGAYCNGRKLKVSNESKLKNCLVVAVLPSKIKNKKKIFNIFSTLNENSRGVLRIGSAAIAYTFLASGKIEAIWGFDNKIWDVAAGILILNEACGKTSRNNDKKYNYKNFLVSSNKKIHLELLKIIK
jgi:myo-inositol-1(or 4)-monophosphatase